MLLVVCVMVAVQLSTSQAAEIIPRPNVAENKPADAAAPEAAAPVDAPAKNVGEILGSNSPVNPANVDSPEPLWGVVICNKKA